jgi:hypothetical protein
MGEFGTIDGERDIPMDDEALKDMLSRRPGSSVEIEREAPPEMPVIPSQGKAKAVTLPQENEGPDKEMKSTMRLPPEDVRKRLKAKYGELKVVPIPYLSGDDGVQCFVMKTLMRSEWRAAEEFAAKTAESKPGVSPQEILEEKVVARAIVWPEFPESEFPAQPAGLITTLFGIAQQMACFFNPEAIMQLTFSL